MNRRQKDRKIPHPLEFLGKNSQRTRDSSWILKGRESLGGKNEGLKVERKLAMKGNSLKGRERGMCIKSNINDLRNVSINTLCRKMSKKNSKKGESVCFKGV